MSDATEKQPYETPRVERIGTSLDTQGGFTPGPVEDASCFPAAS